MDLVTGYVIFERMIRMNKTKQATAKPKRDWKAASKKVTRKIKGGLKFVGERLWSARSYIFAIFTGMFALFAHGWAKGYGRRVDEEGEELDKRMRFLDKLAGQNTEDVDEIEEARDLIDEYSIDALREAACNIEDGLLEEDKT
jgi:hypothetical protein